MPCFDFRSSIYSKKSQGKPSPRTELLHNIDPLEAHRGTSMYPDIFDTRVRAAIRSGDWKLMTGKIGMINSITLE